MRWQPDVSHGAWIAERLDGGTLGATMHSVVPHGFAAYARVFHPIEGQRPVGSTWDDLRRNLGPDPIEWERRSPSWHELTIELGLMWHPLVQWNSLIAASGEDGNWNGTPGLEGWRYSAPAMGSIPAALLARLARVLASHTTTPDSGQAAVWEGHGGLMSNDGYTYITFFSDDDDDDDDDAEERALQSEAADGPPLGPEIAAGARLELPARNHVLFDLGIDELIEESWPERAQWVRAQSPFAVTPSLIWPGDRAWVLVTEVDYDSTVVAGSAELVAELCATPGIEAEPLEEGADLSWEGDRLNR